jgi:phage shock protein PspC (stress-responsive transcriptional regulator)
LGALARGVAYTVRLGLQGVHMALADDLGKLAELRANGTLTEEEFKSAKERLLGSESAGTRDPLASTGKPFRRSGTDRWFGGVCGGIAKSTGTESWIWRLIFTTLFVCAGVGLLLYVLLWIFVPSE